MTEENPASATAGRGRAAILILGKRQGSKPENRQLRARASLAAALFRCVIVLRARSNCTLIELRAAGVMTRAHRLGQLTAITHPYHSARSRRLLSAVYPPAEVLTVRPSAVRELEIPRSHSSLFSGLGELIDASMMRGLDLARERSIEWLLTHIHHFDPRGRFERRLASALRPRAQRRQR